MPPAVCGVAPSVCVTLALTSCVCRSATPFHDFSGSHVVIHLVKKYPTYRIVNFDKLDYCSSLKNLVSIEDMPNYKFIKVRAALWLGRPPAAFAAPNGCGTLPPTWAWHTRGGRKRCVLWPLPWHSICHG